jgi:hypothetical protein
MDCFAILIKELTIISKQKGLGCNFGSFEDLKEK